MKIIILSGSHSRHLFIHTALLDSGYECAVVIMQRENEIPKPPFGTLPDDIRLFNRHFEERYELEHMTFGDLTPQQIFNGLPTYHCTPDNFNSQDVVAFVKTFNADMAFIFGTDLVKGELLKALPSDKINLHLGLSPWYRGSATLFWPFYFLQPQFSGVTFHQIIPEADAGGILHQVCPVLKKGDGIHEVGVRCVQCARSDLIRLSHAYEKKGKFSYLEQKSTGKLFLSNDFQVAHLRVIYDQYENKIVDEYLKGNLNQNKPKIINAF